MNHNHLTDAVMRLKGRRNERLRQRYQLLREAGFSAEEAMVLQHKGLKVIEGLIARKKGGKNV